MLNTSGIHSDPSPPPAASEWIHSHAPAYGKGTFSRFSSDEAMSPVAAALALALQWLRNTVVSSCISQGDKGLELFLPLCLHLPHEMAVGQLCERKLIQACNFLQGRN